MFRNENVLASDNGKENAEDLLGLLSEHLGDEIHRPELQPFTVGGLSRVDRDLYVCVGLVIEGEPAYEQRGNDVQDVLREGAPPVADFDWRGTARVHEVQREST